MVNITKSRFDFLINLLGREEALSVILNNENIKEQTIVKILDLIDDKDLYFQKVLRVNRKYSEKYLEFLYEKFSDKFNSCVSFSFSQRLSALPRSKSFLSKFKSHINWHSYCSRYNLQESFIREFQDEVSWEGVSTHSTLSEYFIREFQDKVHWFWISRNQILSEAFIREFHDKVDWRQISEFQILSEDFMLEYAHKIDWHRISKYQELSEQFIKEFKKKLTKSFIAQHQKISNEFFEKRIKTKTIKTLSNNFNITKDQKLEQLKKEKTFDVIDNEYIIAYKKVSWNLSDVDRPGFVYKINKMAEQRCNGSLDQGILLMSKRKAMESYGGSKILEFKVKIDDICFIHDWSKVMCYKAMPIKIITY